ncbi:complement C1s subcomponent-like [Mustelus asterias]
MWKNNGTVLPQCIPVCGKPSNPVVFRERILRGSVAKRGNFPWQVLFQQPRGAGALISDQWVLTAAHVVDGTTGLSMVAGITSTKHLERDGTRLRHAAVFVHPGYQSDAGHGHNYDNDIALVRLRSKVRLGPDLSPVCLPSRDAQHELPVTKVGLVSGWGLTENDTLPTDLMFVRLPIREMAECRNLTTGHQVSITDNMICAGDQDGSDSCQGDSGGAFVFSRPKPRRNEFFVGGIVSWGIRCGTFGFYTKVMNYLDWIEETMRNNLTTLMPSCPDAMDVRLLSMRSLLVLWALIAVTLTELNHSSLFGEIYLTNYHHRETRSWDITVPPGFALRLHFRHYDSLQSSSCEQQYMEAFADRQRLGTLCGDRSLVQVHFPSSKLMANGDHIVKLRARFNSLDQESRRGFSLFYEAIDIDECGFRWDSQSACDHFCHNYIGGYQCLCRKGYSLQSDRRTCKVTDCGAPEDLENGGYDYVTALNVTLLASVIKYKCDKRYYTLSGGGDGLYTCNANGKWMNRKVGQILPSCKPVCGKPEVPPSPNQRILGGTPAEEGNFPWHVYFENTVCGGALISDQWVLTSASCVQHQRTMRMFAGGSDRNVLTRWRLLEGKEIVPHPLFARLPGDRPRLDFDNDLALIKLKRRVKMGPTISPICLPAGHPLYQVAAGKVGYLSGFGKTEDFAQTDVLMFASVPVAERSRCGNASGAGDPIPLTANMLCAGGRGSDACTGDGGGALVFEDPLGSNAYYVGGIVSWGIRCGTYGIYTNVMKYLEWIESTVGVPKPAQ